LLNAIEHLAVFRAENRSEVFVHALEIYGIVGTKGKGVRWAWHALRGGAVCCYAAPISDVGVGM
jgi:hypothetical protein